MQYKRITIARKGNPPKSGKYFTSSGEAYFELETGKWFSGTNLIEKNRLHPTWWQSEAQAKPVTFEMGSASKLHELAMNFSFYSKPPAQVSITKQEYAKICLSAAATIESICADAYIETDIEPTRTIMIRSAAWLNYKAGEKEKALKYFNLIPNYSFTDAEKRKINKLKTELK